MWLFGCIGVFEFCSVGAVPLTYFASDDDVCCARNKFNEGKPVDEEIFQLLVCADVPRRCGLELV